MTKATKRLPRKISTVDQAVRAFGGIEACAEAFHTTADLVQQWRKWKDWPCAIYLGLYLGLIERGFNPSPRQFKVRRLEDLAGV
jgi:hypothetical protein